MILQQTYSKSPEFCRRYYRNHFGFIFSGHMFYRLHYAKYVTYLSTAILSVCLSVWVRHSHMRGQWTIETVQR